MKKYDLHLNGNRVDEYGAGIGDLSVHQINMPENLLGGTYAPESYGVVRYGSATVASDINYQILNDFSLFGEGDRLIWATVLPQNLNGAEKDILGFFCDVIAEAAESVTLLLVLPQNQLLEIANYFRSNPDAVKLLEPEVLAQQGFGGYWADYALTYKRDAELVDENKLMVGVIKMPKMLTETKLPS